MIRSVKFWFVLYWWNLSQHYFLIDKGGVRNVPNDDVDPGILGGLRRWGSMTNPAIPDHLVDPRGN
jgi:hypothetical protein